MLLKLSELIFFTLAALYGSTGLYAHNYQPFFELEQGDIVRYHEETYIVFEVWEFQALQPNSIYSDFYGYGQYYTVEQMFFMVFRPNILVLFTCIEKDGLSTWGRLFVMAVPIERIPQ